MLDYTLINNSWTTIRSGYIIKPNLYSESEIKTRISNDTCISKNAIGKLYCYLFVNITHTQNIISKTIIPFMQ